MSARETPGRGAAASAFFVGYLPTPRPLAVFVALAAAAMAGIGVGAGLALALAQQDHGKGRFAFDLGYQSLAGVVQARPYPVLRLPPGPDGEGPRTIVLSGRGKRGVFPRAAELDGERADVGGVFVIRDGARLLQVGGRVGMRPAKEPAALEGFAPAPDVPLGRFRLRGEILDSKCYLGAMRPGRGKVHMSCAGLCLMGGIPPMFAVYRDGRPPDLLLLAGPDGGPIPEDMLDSVSLYVALEGEVSRRDDLLVFRVDPASLEAL